MCRVFLNALILVGQDVVQDVEAYVVETHFGSLIVDAEVEI